MTEKEAIEKWKTLTKEEKKEVKLKYGTLAKPVWIYFAMHSKATKEEK